MKKSLYIIDVETSSPDPEKPDLSLDPRRNKLDLIGVLSPPAPAPDDFKKEVVVIQHPEQIANFKHQLALKRPDLGGHHLKFDYKTLHYKGFPLTIEQYAHDSLVMATALATKVPDSYIESYEKERRRLNESLPKGQKYREAKKHSLKVLAPYFLGVSPFWENPATTNDPEYLKKDVEYTAGLIDNFIPMMKKEGVWQFYSDRLMPWTRMTLEAELDGIHIDLDAMAELQAKAEAGVISSLKKLREAWKKVEEEWDYKQRKELRKRYHDMGLTAQAKVKAKSEEERLNKAEKVSARYYELFKKAEAKIEPFNYASPAQLLWAFKEVLHYPVTNMEGDETTGASVLELLAAQGKEDIKALLEYKENYKLAHSYFPSYRELVNNNKLNCNFNIHGTRTGRLSCSEPNLQQIPSGIKRMFTAAPGNVLVAQDLSAIEVVLIAYYTEDETLCHILQDGADFHGVATVDFFELNIDPADVKTKCPEMRYAAKQGDLSIFYGSGKKRLFTTLTLNGIKEIRGKPLTEQMCAAMVKRFRERFSEAWDFKQMLDAELIAGNPAENMFGRKFQFENPEEVYMRGFNRLIQGSASDLLLQGTLDCLKEMKASNIPCGLRLLVHDQAVLECAEKDAEHVNARLIHHITKFSLKTKHGLVPLKAEGGISKVWE